ncbi:N,N-dimethylformamidase beta subunit family domain-containing protein [uncultured Azohydromonas sp.]|uniref:N,N-dimethylformamidase beta subunit family domain-containing protein n=1 Tax=uncultured Azohydromonas sp. TaxID=487342 RepID=UPI00261C7ABB|nr:N,N-dimethylformamidase beta subunit family domain-containing protein [uncultured Azohydromonas sp.]
MLQRQGSRASVARGWLVLLLLGWVLALASWTRPALAADPAQGPGGPILVLTSGNSNFGTYYAEILRNEGFNAFAVAEVGSVNAATLSAYDVVILAKTTLSASQVTMLTDWVNAGGNLIAMAPGANLASLLGLASTGTQLSNGYLLVDTANPVGNGIVNQTMQFHGTADRYALSGATALATLYSSATAATTNPAVTLRSVGSGKAAAFTYDLATSVVYTRQGNPAWAAQERDGLAPIRSDDKFYGNAAADPRADWVDLSKVAIPQADEQQRLLANLITYMNLARKPLPRFWYFPHGHKAVVIMTGDDHANSGTPGRFDYFKSQSTPGCSVANWECIRGTSYVYTDTALTAAQAAQYDAEGFEISLHVSTRCDDYTPLSLDDTYGEQLGPWQAKYNSLPAPVTQRHHCIVWSDWSSGAQVQAKYGMRLDTSYYFWPPGWVADVPGIFTGSAMPMRFMRLDGAFIDVYQAATQMTDESGQSYPYTVNTLLDRALGAEGYYGAYTVNAHTDQAIIDEATTVVASAKARGVPVVSARQMLTWLDARNASAFSAMSWNGSALNFSVSRSPAANGLQGMLPRRSGGNVLTGLTRGGSAVAFSVKVVKGVEYAFFNADSGSYVATYAADVAGPTVSSTTPAAGATGVSLFSTVKAVFNDTLDASTLNASTFELRNAANATVAASLSYDPTTRTATLTPSGALSASTTYTATLRGGTSDPRIKDASGNPMASSVTWSFTTVAASTEGSCPCTAWGSTATPNNPSENDPNAVELGVKFRVDVDGFITGVRFYKGTGNTGTHIGNLWSLNGTRLATAPFTSETATGWQQVNFATPVPVSANTVYVASYYAPNGRYAGDNNFFSTKGVDNAPVHLLQNGVSGGNGVYAYGSSSSYPAQTYQASNYWVDVVFTPAGTTPGPDTTAPAVTGTSPANAATGVPTTSSITATFSEAVDPATVGSSTFELRSAGGTLVPATVTYNAASRTATLTPGASLAASTAYTATVRGGGTDPRVKDLAGNALASSATWSFTTAAAPTGGCATAANPIVQENCLTGNLPSEWEVSGAGDSSIQGFATQMSVNRGGTISFKVDTNASNYRFDIYRLGYYGGRGARKITSVNPSATLPQNQPNCLTQPSTGLVDCGNWAVSGSWTVPANAVSGIYIARLVRADTGGASHIVFVVRDDASTSAMVFQTSDTTWQAYNTYGGGSFYSGGLNTGAGRSFKLSYNRPFITGGVDGGQDWLFHAEYPMVRWLEANGYDVSYISGIDTDRSGSLLLNHKVFLSVGHDEYWSGAQRANVEAARNAGVHLAFFSGNEVFWKTRWENSIDGSNTPYRTLVSYKETHANAKIDPSPAWTGTWRDPRLSPPADGGRPENALTGTIFMNNDTGRSYSITVPQAEGRMRFWRNTTVATLGAGQSATLSEGVLGYEFDSDLDNGARPPGLIRLSQTAISSGGMLLDHGSSYGSGTVTHYLTLYRHPAKGALVFGAGTIQWSWGLDANHTRPGTAVDQRMRQATVNLFADMGVQPATLQSPLVAATASTDTTAPTVNITAPANGANVPSGSSVTVTGTASDTGGVVGAVEVSTNNGATWRPASGRGNWSYTWTPTGSGTATILVRAVDDSGNIQSTPASRSVTVGAATCPCSAWPASATPAVASNTSDTAIVNLGMKFRVTQNGRITGVRFYKGSGNTGTHVGALWTASGTLLASAPFVNETATGWQQVNFTTPVTVTANTVYVVSYRAPNGRYAINSGYFANAGVDRGPIHVLQDGESGANGVYIYGGTSVRFPTSTYQSSNYWVDVVFVPN